MAAVFISHSSQDRAVSEDLNAVLAKLGFERVFLDFDKDSGIGAGEDWERRLYEELARCHAVLLVLTPQWLASKWCFAELVQARALGKIIIPILCAPLGPGVVLPAVQAIDLVSWNSDGVSRLEERLRGIFDELARGFEFDPQRPPYPGINAFEAEDASIYFGRDEEIRSTIERLEARRRHGGARLLTIVGASGSGKSSLLRAGVLPQLKRQRRQWILLSPIRPDKAPLEALAKAIATRAGVPNAWRDWYARLHAPDAVDHINEFLKDLRIADLSAATLLLPIDQFEELFTVSEPSEKDAFIRILTDMLSATRDFPVMAIATARADVLQGVLESGDLAAITETIPLTSMPLDRVARLVEGPAGVAAITVETGLSERIVRDVAHAEALPLLAYTLRLLHERSSERKRLTHAAYAALGDAAQHLNPVQNSIRLAADQALAGTRPSDEELAALRDAFIPHLVRLRLDDGSRVRQPARLDDLPRKADRLLRALVGARLLTTRGSETEADRDVIVEVTHEALFQAWPTLAAWLTEEQAFLSDIERMKSALQTWQEASDEGKPQALMSGLLLSRSREWLTQFPQRFVDRGANSIARFIALSAAEADEQAERVRRRRRRTLRGAIAAALIFAVTSVVAGWQYMTAAAERERAADQARRAELAFDAARGAVDSLLYNITDGLINVEGMRAETVRKILETVQRTIEDLARRAPDDLQLQRSLAAMWQRFGDVFRRVGDSARARDAYAKCLEIGKHVIANEPNSPRNQLGLTACLDRIGEMRVLGGDERGAREAFEESLAIRRTLAQAEPTNTDTKMAVTISLERLGDLRRSSGDASDARAAFEEALSIRRAIFAANPSNRFVQFAISVSLEKLGDLRLDAGDPEGALVFFQESHDIRVALLEYDAGNTEWARALSASLERIGGVEQARGDHGRAIAAYEKSLAIRRKLVALDSANADWQRTLGIALRRLGHLRWDMKEREKAGVAFAEALDIFRDIAKRDAADVRSQHELADELESVGYLYATQSDTARALAHFEECLAIRRTLMGLDPSNERGQTELAITLERVARARFQQKDLPGALQAQKDALDILRRLAGAHPTDSERQLALASALDNMAGLTWDAGPKPEALRLFDEAIGILRAITDADLSNAALQQRFWNLLDRAGHARLELQDATAVAVFVEGVTVARRLVHLDASNNQWQQNLWHSLTHAGDEYLKAGKLSRAAEAYDEALPLARRISAQASGDNHLRSHIAGTLDGFAEIKLAAGDRGGALAAFEESLAIRRELAAGEPTNFTWQGEVAESLRNIARASDDRDRKRTALTEALQILAALGASGALSDEQRQWRKEISDELGAL